MAFMPDFSNLHVLVIGDVMLDRYWHGDTSRISPEAPVPIVNIGRCQERPGGAANVALNLKALGAKTTLIGAIGEDEAGVILEKELTARGVACVFHREPQLLTITKLRVLGRHQQLLRLDFEQKMPSLADYLEGFIASHLKRADIVILSDYAKGVLSEPEKFIRAAKRAHKKVLVDPKSNNLLVYAGADLITPNLKEFEAAVGICTSETEIVENG
ncbi:MAG TPA: PfkB family carbohydrate kinase, partial [Gammaproteobacteria bacterium]|nr:PfkB family carbohydrate kinase [Gammaproteobacteria bacterium]